MDGNISKAFYDIHLSFKEILKQKQRHLYCNMLDLLFTACKTATLSAILKQITYDELVDFWVEDILPLLFDTDQNIQKSAILSMEQGLSTLDLGNIQNYSQWNDLKSKIIKIHSPAVHKLQEHRNPYWNRIWSILLRILDSEIIKKASAINPFLSIVELGFRSSDSNVRAEAFTCWRQLIEVFNENKQLTVPKRLKLICIPFKSTQSKSAHVAVVKIRIWWYLLKCLEKNLEQYFENVVQPFLAYTFGSESKNTQGAAEQYSSVRDIALPSIAALVMTEKNDYIEKLLFGMQLDILQPPSTICGNKLLEIGWRPLVYSSLKAIHLLIDNEILQDTHLNLLSLLIKYVTFSMIRLDLGLFYSYFCNGLIQIAPKSTRPINLMINVIATNELQLKTSLKDFENLGTLVKSLTNILTFGNEVGPLVRQQYIRNVFSLEAFLPGKNVCRAVGTISNCLLCSESENIADFEVRLQIWRHISFTIIDFVEEDKITVTPEDDLNILLPWTIWPLQKFLEFTGTPNGNFFDKATISIWKKLLHLNDNSSVRIKHSTKLRGVLDNLLNIDCEEQVFIELLDGYVNEILNFDCNSFEQHENMFKIIIKTLNKYQPAKEKLLIILRNILCNLQGVEISHYQPLAKTAIEYAVRNTTKGSVDLKFLEEWKNSVINIIRSYSDKTFFKQISDLLRDSNSFVIIPSVWSLKPDKLTDRQKERIAEKTNIPALYNDMSQSQDNLIKPWTPKKVVIAKDNENEIILDATQSEMTSIDISGSICLNISDQSIASAGKHRKSVENETCNSALQNTLMKNTAIERNIATNSDEKCHQNNIDIAAKGDKTVSEGNITHEEIQQDTTKVDHNSHKETFYQDEQSITTPPKHNERCGSLDDSDNNFVQKSKGQNHQQDNMGPETNTSLETELQKEFMSPKKTISKGGLLSSPPDRKLINNSSSPKVRPKPPATLTGRGAQFINIVRNRKIDTQQATPIPLSRLLNSKSETLDRIAPSDQDLVENTSTPLQMKDLLTFSKRLPSPSASPSSSILKRNLCRESLEEANLDSPALKKKRVSFHDPPVSATKEYIKDLDESKSKPKRCLILDKNDQSAEKSSETRYALKRRSKLDSLSEIEMFSQNGSKKSLFEGNVLENETRSVAYSKRLSNEDDCLNEDIPIVSKNISQVNSNEVLDFVVQKYSLEDVLKKYLDTEHELQAKSINTMAKTLSHYMNENINVKEKVLEALSESHSKDFLDHAVRENLASVVCDRLNLQSVIEYICEKSKINNFSRNILLSNIPEVIRHCKQDCDRMNVIDTILESINLTDSNICEVMALILRKRSSDAHNLLNVSESAIDSSSNL